jgi:hypothetical protein
MRHLYASSFLMDDWLRRLYNLMAEMNDKYKALSRRSYG